jgi:hypothetical protein
MPIKRGKGQWQRSRSRRRLAVERLEDRTMLSASAGFPALLAAHGLSGNYGPAAHGAPAPAPSGAAGSTLSLAAAAGCGPTEITPGVLNLGSVSTGESGLLAASGGAVNAFTGGTFVSGGTMTLTNQEDLADGSSLYVGADGGDYGSSLAVGSAVAYPTTSRDVAPQEPPGMVGG